MLSQALREMERQRAREKLRDEKGTDVHYLKNVILKMFETGARHASPHRTACQVPEADAATKVPSGIHGKPFQVHPWEAFRSLVMMRIMLIFDLMSCDSVKRSVLFSRAQANQLSALLQLLLQATLHSCTRAT